jgi:hypothetical protein
MNSLLWRLAFGPASGALVAAYLFYRRFVDGWWSEVSDHDAVVRIIAIGITQSLFLGVLSSLAGRRKRISN